MEHNTGSTLVGRCVDAYLISKTALLSTDPVCPITATLIQSRNVHNVLSSQIVHERHWSLSVLPIV